MPLLFLLLLSAASCSLTPARRAIPTPAPVLEKEETPFRAELFGGLTGGRVGDAADSGKDWGIGAFFGGVTLARQSASMLGEVTLSGYNGSVNNKKMFFTASGIQARVRGTPFSGTKTGKIAFPISLEYFRDMGDYPRFLHALSNDEWEGEQKAHADGLPTEGWIGGIALLGQRWTPSGNHGFSWGYEFPLFHEDRIVVPLPVRVVSLPIRRGYHLFEIQHRGGLFFTPPSSISFLYRRFL